MNPIEISDLLRRRILADLHLGWIKPGRRLPSLRIVARELGVSIRAVARAYTELQREGLVEVRGRSGIYLVQPHASDIDLQEPFNWYADMLKQAWSRRIALLEVNGVLQALVANPLRVACVESTEDHMVAFCAELEHDFSLNTTSVQLTGDGARVGDKDMALLDALAPADFIVTTAFHAADVRRAAEMLNKPIVLVSVNDTLVSAIEKELTNQPVTVVAHDPAFVDRFRTYLIERFRANGDLRVVNMHDIAERPNLVEGTTALYTRAARRLLKEQEYHLLPPPIPFLSSHAARRIVQCMLSTHAKRALRAA